MGDGDHRGRSALVCTQRNCRKASTRIARGTAAANLRIFVALLLISLTVFSTASTARATDAIPQTLTDIPMTPAPGLNSEITGLACQTDGPCYAVGYECPCNDTFSTAIIFSESNNVWAMSVAPLPSDADLDGFSHIWGITCGDGFCVAIGDYDNSVGSQGLILTEFNGAWSATKSPLPDDRTSLDGHINLIACGQSGSCVAAGWLTADSGAEEGILLAQVRGTWSATTAPLPPDAVNGETSLNGFGGASCPPVGGCTVVGSYGSTHQGPGASGVILTQSGKTWTASEAPPPEGQSPGFSDLGSVSCPKLGSCVAGGDDGLNAILATQSGSTWTTTISPLPSDAYTITDVSAGIGAVSCPSPGACTAVGYYSSTDPSPFMAVTESSGNWTANELPLPETDPNGSNDSIYGLTCVQNGSCVAVGTSDGVSESSDTVIETESSGEWSASRAPMPSPPIGPGPLALNLVACSSVGNCFEAGDAFSNSNFTSEEGMIVSGTGGTTASRYVALGDSIPYGHGLANPGKKSEGGLPPDMGPSSSAYPSLVAHDLGLSLTLRTTGCTLSGDNLAISGAPSVDNTWSGKDSDCHYKGKVPLHKAVSPDELNAAQLAALPPTLVTIQVGADDVDFAGCLAGLLGLPKNPFFDSTTCVEQSGADGSYYLPTRVLTELASLRTGLTDIIQTVHSEAPYAQIAVLDYYQPIPTESEPLVDTIGASPICVALNVAQASGKLASISAQADFLQGQLNSVILEVANSFDYVTPVDISGAFAGHEMCVADTGGNSQNWVFNAIWNAAHPTATGQQQIAAAIESALGS
jgi:lysophospholipase L1-like esterase